MTLSIWVLEFMISRTEMAKDVATVVMPTLAMIKQLSHDVKYMPVPVDKRASVPRRRADPEASSALERARRGHCMCGDGLQ